MIVAGAVSIAAVGPFLVFLMLRIANVARRSEAEARIREAEADAKESDAAFARARARLANRVLDEIDRHGLRDSGELAEELLRQASPTIAPLRDHPVIGNVGITLPKG